MSESQELEQQPAPERPGSREDELTRRVARWVEGPLVTVAVLICTYYGGSQYGDSHYVSHPLWQNVILWPILLASFVLLIIDRAGHRRKDMPVSPEMSRAERRALRVRRQTPHRRVSRWVARRIIARQEQKGIGHYGCHPGGAMTCLECGVECAEAVQVCARCGAPVAVPESAADSAVGMVRGAAGHEACAGTAYATGQTSPEPNVSGRGARVPPEIRRVLHGYSWMASGAVFGGWALFAVGGYFANLGNSYDFRFLFAGVALAVVAAFLLGRHIRWSWFLRQPRNPCSAAVAACQRGGRALMLDAPSDGVPSGLKVRLAWWAEPEMLQPGENVTYCGRRGGVGMLLVSSSARDRAFVATGRRRPARPSGEGAVQEAPHQPGSRQSWRRHLRWGPMVMFGLGLVAAVGATLIAWVPPLTGHLGAAQLRAGECLTASNLSLDSGNPWPWFTAVRCTDLHLAEVFFAGNAWPRSLAYPGDNAISDQGLARCSTAFAAYDGSDADQSMFSISYVQPWGDNWATGNRWLACIAYEPGTLPLSNSIKGSGH